MAKRPQRTLTITVSTPGLRGTLAAFQRLPKSASDALRDQSLELARTLAVKVAAAGRADSPQSALMAPTVVARRDRVPVIVAGGTRRVGSRRKPAYKILFGSEFGSTHLPQFRPHLGRGSYWFFETVYDSQPQIMAAWNAAADTIVSDWSKGGDE